jgi:maltooligosyltrehalose trehalohydrolase
MGGRTTCGGSSMRHTRAASACCLTSSTTTSGDAIKFDGPDSAPVREFFITNAAYWIDEFHVDGLRLDATQQIFDASQPHIITAIGHAEAYYSDTYGVPQEFISSAKYGYLYQGQYYHWQRHRRGTPTCGLPPAAFVVYLQNHDQLPIRRAGCAVIR